MLYWEIIAVCSPIHTKHINILYGQNVELVNAKLGGTSSGHWALGRSNQFITSDTLTYVFICSQLPQSVHIKKRYQQ